MVRMGRFFGRALHRTVVALGALVLGGAILAIANYAATQGSGTNFGSIVVSTVHYAQMLLCDPTTPSQCGAVSSTGRLAVAMSDGSSNAITSQSANAHVAPDVVINDANGNRLNGLTTGTLGSPSTQYLSVQNADPCSYAAKSSASIAITSAATTSLVAVSGSTAVYVCGFSVTISEVATTANTIQFEYGTGASCTGTHALTGTMGAGGVTAGAPIVVAYGSGGSTVFNAPASNGICAVTAIGASGSFEGVLTYVQQ
jgi:hypothetical protein